MSSGFQSRVQALASKRFSEVLACGHDVATRRPVQSNGYGLCAVVQGFKPCGTPYRLGAAIQSRSGNIFWVK